VEMVAPILLLVVLRLLVLVARALGLHGLFHAVLVLQWLVLPRLVLRTHHAALGWRAAASSNFTQSVKLLRLVLLALQVLGHRGLLLSWAVPDLRPGLRKPNPIRLLRMMCVSPLAGGKHVVSGFRDASQDSDLLQMLTIVIVLHQPDVQVLHVLVYYYRLADKLAVRIAAARDVTVN
jgi:hypothetical protein